MSDWSPGAMVERHYWWVEAVVRFLVRDDHAPAQLVEQAFLDAVNASGPAPTERAFVARLAVAAERRALAATASDAEADPLRRAVIAVPQRERALLLLRFAARMPLNDARRVLGLRPVEAAALQLRALRRLSTLLGGSGDPDAAVGRLRPLDQLSS